MGALAPRASSPDDRGFALGPLSVCPPAKQLPFSQDCPTAAAAAALLAQRRAPGDLCRPGDYEGHSSRRGQALPSQGRRGGASRPSRVGPGCLRPSRRAPSRRKEGGACLASPRLTCLQRGPQVRRRTWAKSMMTTHEKTSAAQAKRPPPSFTQRSWAGRGPLYSELRPSEASKGLAWGWRGRKQPAAPPPRPSGWPRRPKLLSARPSVTCRRGKPSLPGSTEAARQGVGAGDCGGASCPPTPAASDGGLLLPTSED